MVFDMRKNEGERAPTRHSAGTCQAEGVGGSDVLALLAENGERRHVKRVADQLDIGGGFAACWVKQHEVDHGERPAPTAADAERIKVVEQENRELP